MNSQLPKSSALPNEKQIIDSITLLLKLLRLPTARRCFVELYEHSQKEGWTPLQWLRSILELEHTERVDRRVSARRSESGLPLGKTIETFDFNEIKGVTREEIHALLQGGHWLSKSENILFFGRSGTGKSHLAAAIGHGLIDHGYRVYYSQTSRILQHMESARKEAKLPEWFKKMDKFDVIILDDISYADKLKVDTGLLFELIADRYESRSLIVASNKPFSLWDDVFPDNARCIAAIDRLVHHGTILELDGDSYRRKTAVQQKKTKLNTEDIT